MQYEREIPKKNYNPLAKCVFSIMYLYVQKVGKAAAQNAKIQLTPVNFYDIIIVS